MKINAFDNVFSFKLIHYLFNIQADLNIPEHLQSIFFHPDV